MAKKTKTKNIPVKVEKPEIALNADYESTLKQLKKQIQEAQLKATTTVNKGLISLYWKIGKTIVEKQENNGWGTKVIEKLAQDLQNEFPGVDGFSRRNMFRMKAFYQAYEKVPQAVAQLDALPTFSIPWGHNAVILEKIKDTTERLWYASKTIEHGWSRSMLTIWIENDLYSREGKAITNFRKTLPSPQSDLANSTLKDPYVFDFLTLQKDHHEKELEQGLIDHIQKFLLELGDGFAFVGRQYHIEVGNKDYYIDLLFYNFKLRSFFVVELKATEFEPRDAGQINFYLSAIDSLLKHPDDKPTIGLIICKNKDNFTAEYALRDIHKPIGVAEYEVKILEKLPKEFKGSLPTIEEIEAELEKELSE